MGKLLLIFSFGMQFWASLSAQEKSKCAGFREAKHETYVIAHRGAHIGIPENSLAACQKAIDLGCDFVEIDVRTTKDGQFVSVHNSTIDNYMNGATGKISDLTLTELKALDIGTKVDKKWKNTRIPTFEEILALCKGKIGIYLDLKDASVPELMKLIRKYEMEDDIVWYIPAKFLMEQNDMDEFFGNSFPMPDPGSENKLEKVLNELKPCAVATDMSILSESYVTTAHRFGVKVFVDEDQGTKKEWDKIIGWKTDGIQTDNPEKLLEYLRKNKIQVYKTAITN